MALIAPQAATIAGTTVTFSAAAGGGDTFVPNTRGVFHVKNGGGAPITATIVVPGNDQYGSARPDIAVVVAAGAEKAIGPFPVDIADPTTVLVSVTYSGVTSVTVAYISV